jgi:hypothetical protein
MSGLGKFNSLSWQRGTKMWLVLFILALMFVLGMALVLLRTAKIPKLPEHIKAQPYQDNSDDNDW